MNERRIVIEQAVEFGRVAVMYGGRSSEREVSLQSGAAVLSALQSRGVDAIGWDPAEKSMADLTAAGFARVWNALHGPGGEDGQLQGALQWLGVPCTGSGILASAVAMDKILSKHLFSVGGIRTPDYLVIETAGEANLAADEFGFPLVIKPAGQGSSVGMSKVFDADELRPAVELALSFGAPVLAEKCVVGSESTVAVLQGQALPSVRIETPRVFYDYRAKYESDNTRYFCPGTDEPELEQRFHDLAIAAFQMLGCSGWGRVDFMTGSDGEPQVLEINTVPGMTSHSLVPIAAQATGMDFAELCWRILETSIVPQSLVEPVGVAANDA